MEKTRFLIVGAGVSGLAFANFIDSEDVVIVERDDAIGGYCKTVKQDGFVWDYSGHFFHFRHPEIEKMLVDRMPGDEVQTIARCSKVWVGDRLIDFPFQKNIHQLRQSDFIDCLYDLFFKDEAYGDQVPSNFKEMVYARFGRSIAEMFLVPYNEKLYACDLSELDVEAMGRFFPYADLEAILRNMRLADNASYNATFTYPRGGAIEYVHALERGVPEGAIRVSTPVTAIDLRSRVAQTPAGPIAFEYLISSAPFDRLLDMSGVAHEPTVFHSNKVLVFNLGFDRKGWTEPHWVYFPETDFVFYRVGFYDNIFDHDRMSLYVEIGATTDETLDVDGTRLRVLADLKRAGVITDHALVSHHSVVLDPAYVHITRESRAAVEQYRQVLGARGVYSIGRYGAWTYCSIEDNILEARALADVLGRVPG